MLEYSKESFADDSEVNAEGAPAASGALAAPLAVLQERLAGLQASLDHDSLATAWRATATAVVRWCKLDPGLKAPPGFKDSTS